MKHLIWHLRVAFHDWMWSGGARPALPRRVARRLPLYFSDPYYVTDDEARVLFPPATVTYWSNGAEPQTFTTGSASNVIVTWRP
jgi:hypothetical protein